MAKHISLVLFTGVIVATACAPSSIDVGTAEPPSPASSPSRATAAVDRTTVSPARTSQSRLAAAEVQTDLARLRRVVAPYHRFEAAQEAGWTALVPRCRDNPPVGGMGWHYANPAYLDGELDVTRPEALIYEPQEDGSMAFVGVEFVVPFSIRPAHAEPPRLLGQTFLQNHGDELWMLHVWVGRPNPNGMFATWNPDVSCRYAG